MNPTKRAVVLFALTIPVALAVVAFRPEWWFVALYPPVLVLALVVADMNLSLPRKGMAVGVNAPVRLFVGRSGVVVVEVETPPSSTTRAVTMTATLELTGDAVSPPPEAGVVDDGHLTLKMTLTPSRRGRVLVEAVRLRWLGPLGLVATRVRRRAGAAVDVVPDIRGVREDALQFFIQDALYGTKSQRQRGEGTEFDRLSDYEPGMESRFIDWKRSARHRKLLCREYRRERNHHIILCFDTGHLMLEPLDGVPRLDHAVRAGMTLGWVSLRHGDLVGGCGFDAAFRGYLQPGRGMRHFTRVQRFAAGLDYRTEETNYTLALTELGARMRRRSMIVVFSEFIDSISAELLVENLQWMAKKHVVVFVTLRDPLLGRLRDDAPVCFNDVARAVIADDFLRERAIVFERIVRAGVHCVDVPARNLSSALLNRYLLIKQRGLL